MLRPASVGYNDIVSFLHQGEEGTSASVLRLVLREGATIRLSRQVATRSSTTCSSSIGE